MLNWIWLGLILGSVAYASFTGHMADVTRASLDEAKNAVMLVLGLIGPMMLFLGLMRVAQEGGLLLAVARALRPVLRRLFPDVPADSPAMSAMIMNLASNMLGLGNAATPFGLKAMVELDRQNPQPGVATNSMALFLAINTSSVVLMAPTGTIAVRAAAGSEHAMAIWVPTLIATTCSTLVAVAVCLGLQRLGFFAPRRPPDAEPPPPGDTPPALPEADLTEPAPRRPAGLAARLLVAAFVAAMGAALVIHVTRVAPGTGPAGILKELAEYWLLPLLIAGLLLVGVAGRVRVYDAMVKGAREGLEVGVRIAPFLLAIIVAVGMFRASGLMQLLVSALDPVTGLIGFPAEALPMALLRPLSGSGAFGVMSEILTEHGPDTFIGYVTSTLQGSTETTFYVLALYYGAARIRDGRHTLAACLSGDVAGFLGATFACHLFFA